MLKNSIFILFLLLSFRVQAEESYQIICQGVYENLKEALPLLLDRKPPKLIFTNDELGTPTYQSQSNEITIPFSTLVFCANYDPLHQKKYIAFILSHELGHWYDKYAPQYLRTAFFNTVLGTDEEVRADYFGEFLCDLALVSYLYLKVEQKENFLKALYQKAYENTPTQIQNRIQNRLETFKKAIQHLRDIRVNLEDIKFLTLFMIEPAYQFKAIELYKKILPSFQSAKIYNNIGATYLRIATQNYYYALPVDIDHCAQVGNINIREGEDKICSVALDSAWNNLQKAQKRNPNLEKLKINLACIHLLKGQKKEATNLVENLLRQTKKNKIKHDCWLIKAILSQKENQFGVAKESLAKAKNYFPNSPYVSINQRQFNPDSFEPSLFSDRPLMNCKELPPNTHGEVKKNIEYAGGDRLCQSEATESFTIQKYESSIPNSFKGKSISEISYYDKMPCIIHENTIFYIFRNVIFFTDKNNEITNWMLYSE